MALDAGEQMLLTNFGELKSAGKPEISRVLQQRCPGSDVVAHTPGPRPAEAQVYGHGIIRMPGQDPDWQLERFAMYLQRNHVGIRSAMLAGRRAKRVAEAQ